MLESDCGFVTARPSVDGRLEVGTWLTLVLIAAAGCGDGGRAQVTGRLIRADQSPLVGARITARSEATGKWASAVTDREGRFVFGTAEKGDGIEPGDYYVIVSEDRGDIDEPHAPTISSKYHNPSQSGLHISVKPGEHATFDAELDAG